METVRNPKSSEAPRKLIETMASETTIEKLPPDVLVQIMEYVPVAQWPSLESVNHTFRDIMYESWRTLRKVRFDEDFVFGALGVKETNLALEKLARRALNVSDICGLRGLYLNGRSVDLLVRFEKLARVDFSGFYMSLDELERFLIGSASRKYLKEVNLRVSLKPLTPRGRRPLLEAFSEQNGLEPLKLETFDLSRNSNLDFSWAFLNEIDVSKLRSFLVINTHVSQSLMVGFLERAVNLRHLEFTFDCCYDEQPRYQAQMHAKEPGPTELLLQLNKKIIQAVGNLENLLSLAMNVSNKRKYCGCRKFDAEMKEMFNKLGRHGTLRKLLLRGQNIVTDEATNSIAVALPELSSLSMDFDKCGAAAAERVLRAQKSLVSLELFVSYASVVPHIVANTPHLEFLHLHLVSCRGVSKEDLLQITALQQLKELCVDNAVCSFGHWRCSIMIDDEVLVAWADSFGSNLESLEIEPCLKVTDEGLSALINKTPHLRKLAIAGSNVTDHFLKEMAARCPNIRELNLSRLPKITLDGVKAIVDGCASLKRLGLSARLASLADSLKVQKYRKICIDSVMI